MRTKRTRRTPKRPAPPWVGPFLEAVGQCGKIQAAAIAAGIARSEVYRRRDTDPGFAEALAAAIEQGRR